MSKIIIGIHGLGNKPPKDLLEKWWLESICEGLKKIDRFKFQPNFEMVYWADILNDKPLNSLITDKENPYFMDEPYIPSSEITIPKEHTQRKKFLGFLEDQMDKLFLNDDLSSKFEFVSEMIFKKYFRELEIYYARQPDINDPVYKSVKDIIRSRLAEVIKKHKGKEILLVSHSMGSIIAYDVCSFVVPDYKIDTLITMGSPLGLPIIVSKIAEEVRMFNAHIKKLTTPKNIVSNWINFSDLEDNVAINYNLSDDYDQNERGIRVKDVIIDNDYQINGERNPHKSYGYLRSRQFSEYVDLFLTKNRSDMELWWTEQLYRFSKLNKKLKSLIKR